MTRKSYLLILLLLSVGLGVWAYHIGTDQQPKIVQYIADPTRQEIAFYLNDPTGKKINHFQVLQLLLSGQQKKLLFAMNGGMFDPQYNPVGLYIENYRQYKKINRNTHSNGSNFLTQPNGIFYIETNGSAHVCKTADMAVSEKIKYATQSGPMLVFDGIINPAFSPGSKKLTTRNGVGILADNRVLFAFAENGISMYDFARYFKNAGCRNALFLDGGVSQIYWPDRDRYFDFGRLGVLIGITEKINSK